MGLPEHISIEAYDYRLPKERIAKYPLPDRDDSNVLVYSGGTLNRMRFRDLPGLLTEHDRLVFNTTRVIRARLSFRKVTGAAIEIFCLDPMAPSDYQVAFGSAGPVEWRCLVGNAKKWKNETLTAVVPFAGTGIEITAENLGRSEDGYHIRFRWNANVSFAQLIEQFGSTPIPPYLERDAEESDARTYQTVYANTNGSVAAPTAGLHFTENVLERIRQQGVRTDQLVLHVGAGTFIPVKEENALRHAMHAEYVEVSRSLLRSLLDDKRRTIAVGTTVTRSLESIYWLGVRSILEPDFNFSGLFLNQWEAYSMEGQYTAEQAIGSLLHAMEDAGLETFSFHTRIMIVPGYRFRMVDRLITNFHQPKSTLLLLIAAFTGGDWRKIYQYAMDNGFRFLSYGDSSMLDRQHPHG
jgi:S-adenosylmethionine:tRNA ribosyltransferase-isomerase